MEGYTLLPAYGRDYRSKAAVEADWKAGKDFVVRHFTGSETYGSIRDFKGKSVRVRYNALRNVCFVKG